MALPAAGGTHGYTGTRDLAGRTAAANGAGARGGLTAYRGRTGIRFQEAKRTVSHHSGSAGPVESLSLSVA